MHVVEHCKTPSTKFKRAGSVWVCTCGQMYVVAWFGSLLGGSSKAWEPYPAPVENKRLAPLEMETHHPLYSRIAEHKD